MDETGQELLYSGIVSVDEMHRNGSIIFGTYNFTNLEVKIFLILIKKRNFSMIKITFPRWFRLKGLLMVVACVQFLESPMMQQLYVLVLQLIGILLEWHVSWIFFLVWTHYIRKFQYINHFRKYEKNTILFYNIIFRKTNILQYVLFTNTISSISLGPDVLKLCPGCSSSNDTFAFLSPPVNYENSLRDQNSGNGTLW